MRPGGGKFGLCIIERADEAVERTGAVLDAVEAPEPSVTAGRIVRAVDRADPNLAAVNPITVGAVAGFVAELERWLTQACTDRAECRLVFLLGLIRSWRASDRVHCDKSRPAVSPSRSGRSECAPNAGGCQQIVPVGVFVCAPMALPADLVAGAALPPRRYLDCRCRDYACQGPSVTDHQFQLLLRYLQVMMPSRASWPAS